MSVCKKHALIPYHIDVENNYEIKMMFVQYDDYPLCEISVGSENEEEFLLESSEKLGVFLPFLTDVVSLGNHGSFILHTGRVNSLNEVSIPDGPMKQLMITLEEFENKGRNSQKHIVRYAHKKIMDSFVSKSD